MRPESERLVKNAKKGGPLSGFAPPLDSGQLNFTPGPRAASGRTWGATFAARCSVGVVRPDFSSAHGLHLPFRGWLRLSLPLSLRGQGGTTSRNRAPQRGLRACRFADIPTPFPIQNKTKEVSLMFSIHSRSASFALDAIANTSALVRQRLSTTSATGIAVVLATPNPQPITGSALLSQHLAVNRSIPRGAA
jgi:hypothetical protein